MIMHENPLKYASLYSCLKVCAHFNNEKDTIPFLCSQPIFFWEFVFFDTKKRCISYKIHRSKIKYRIYPTIRRQ